MTQSCKPKSWRDCIAIHPAAELFQPMSERELRELGSDIQKHGLRVPIALCKEANGVVSLLDGRNRLDAMEAAGIKFTVGPVPIGDWVLKCADIDLDLTAIRCLIVDAEDAYSFVVSVNLHRRHLTADQKRDLIAEVLKAMPEKSDRQIAKATDSNRTTVGQIRAKMERSSDVSIVDTRIDTKGRKQVAHKPTTTKPPSKDAPAVVAADRAEERAESKCVIPGVGMAPHDERGLDLYETPPAAVRALLDVEPVSGTIWEPACGPGSIVRILREAGHRVVATDLAHYGCPDSRGGIDFLLQSSAPDNATTILTNPPFMQADEFVRKALQLVPRVMMLLRLAFLESQGRSDILDGGQLARVYPFRNRLPMMHRDGWTGPFATSAMAFAWLVWEREHHGPATLSRISWTNGSPSRTAIPEPHIPDFLDRRRSTS
jgi:hypothetical protein